MLDTDVLSLIMRGRLPDPGRARIRALAPDQLATTAVSVGELFYGALRHPDSARILRAVGLALEGIACLPFDRAAGERYGQLRAYLESAGRRLDDPDLRIASICLATDSALVSGNARHFARIPGLRLENWARG